MRERTKSNLVTIDEVADKEIATAHEKGYPEPDFDFRKQYQKGMQVFYLHVIPNLGIKEILTLTVRSIYARSITAFEPKSVCYTIPYTKRNMLFTNRAEALLEYENIDVKEVF